MDIREELAKLGCSMPDRLHVLIALHADGAIDVRCPYETPPLKHTLGGLHPILVGDEVTYGLMLVGGESSYVTLYEDGEWSILKTINGHGDSRLEALIGYIKQDITGYDCGMHHAELCPDCNGRLETDEEAGTMWCDTCEYTA